MSKTIISKQGTLQGRDWLKGLLIGAATAVVWAAIEFLQRWLADGGDIFAVDGKELLRAAVAGLIAYIGKNLLEPTKVVQVKVGEAAQEAIREQSKA